MSSPDPVASAQFDGASSITICTARHIISYKIPQIEPITSICGSPFIHATVFNGLIAAVADTDTPPHTATHVLLYQLSSGVFLKSIDLAAPITSLCSTEKFFYASLKSCVYVFDSTSFRSVSVISRVSEKSAFYATPSIVAWSDDNSPGSVLIATTPDFTMKTQIKCHNTPIRTFALSDDGSLIVTASEKGTMVRVFSTSDGSKISEFRRGFTPGEVLVVDTTSDFSCACSRNTVHVFAKGGKHLTTSLSTKPLACKLIQTTLMIVETSGILSVFNINADSDKLELNVQHRLLSAVPTARTRGRRITL